MLLKFSAKSEKRSIILPRTLHLQREEKNANYYGIMKFALKEKVKNIHRRIVRAHAI